jgi:hypothetical protein
MQSRGMLDIKRIRHKRQRRFGLREFFKTACLGCVVDAVRLPAGHCAAAAAAAAKASRKGCASPVAARISRRAENHRDDGAGQ